MQVRQGFAVKTEVTKKDKPSHEYLNQLEKELVRNSDSLIHSIDDNKVLEKKHQYSSQASFKKKTQS